MSSGWAYLSNSINQAFHYESYLRILFSGWSKVWLVSSVARSSKTLFKTVYKTKKVFSMITIWHWNQSKYGCWLRMKSDAIITNQSIVRTTVDFLPCWSVLQKLPIRIIEIKSSNKKFELSPAGSTVIFVSLTIITFVEGLKNGVLARAGR